MSLRTPLLLLGGLAALAACANPAVAQCGSGYYPVTSSAVYYRDLGGEVYYYDRAGSPLYYDDYAHYNHPRRFYYNDGGWVLESRGRGYYGRYRGSGHDARYGYYARHGSYAPRHQAGYSGHGRGYSGRHGGYSGGHHAGRGGGHGHH